MVRRMLPALAVLAALLIVAALWSAGARDAYFGLFRLLGVPAYRFPFVDTHAVLAVIDCHRRGVDVYVSNPCDVMGRVHVYTPLWLRLAALPITASWTPLVGMALAVTFALSLLLLPSGRDWQSACLICVAALSPAVVFAVERGNADLLMFALAALAGWLVLRRLPTRLLAFPIVVLAAALKLYPATLLLLALRERRVPCLVIAALSLAALLAYAVIDAAGLREMLAVVPGGTPFIYSFGARNLPDGLGILFGWPPFVSAVLQTALMVAVVVFAGSQARMLRAAVAVLTPAEAVGLMIGAVLILGCFVMGQSGEYRAVHLLFVLPALIVLASVPGPARQRAGGTVWIILSQLWGDLVSAPLHDFVFPAVSTVATARAAEMLWVAREIAWWWTVAMLLALLSAVVMGLRAVADLSGRRWDQQPGGRGQGGMQGGTQGGTRGGTRGGSQ
jgi:hypothetical protein